MRKVIRLTESDLIRVVKRIVKEDTQAQVKQKIEQNAQSCFNAKKFPELAKLMKFYSLSLATLAIIGVSVLATTVSAGTTAGLGFTSSMFTGSKAYETFKDLMDDPNSSLKNELIAFLKCIGVYPS